MRAERGTKILSGVLAVGLLSSPGMARASESDPDSPPRPLAPGQNYETKSNKEYAQFEKKGPGRFDGKITLVNLKPDEPEPTPHPLALGGQKPEADKPNALPKKPVDTWGKPNRLGYYQMPESINGSYEFIDKQCRPEHWGSREMIKNMHIVAGKWKEYVNNDKNKEKTKGEGKIRWGDLNGPAWEHASHKKGNDVDLNATFGKDWVGNMKRGNYNREATIELAKMFADTGKVQFIFFNDEAVRNAVDKYKGWKKDTKMQKWPHHDDHFHVRFNVPELPRWAPQGEDKYCSVKTSND